MTVIYIVSVFFVWGIIFSIATHTLHAIRDYGRREHLGAVAVARCKVVVISFIICAGIASNYGMSKVYQMHQAAVVATAPVVNVA
ncbi:hypothetical protein pEaSNUABM11_00291 [Erwinia phage pEa_SNUABM_11]|nr:hypothetical protein pEaSNUABM11_00291 [Erwinia phage pEa_SNUABM_11]